MRLWPSAEFFVMRRLGDYFFSLTQVVNQCKIELSLRLIRKKKGSGVPQTPD
ncbi:hypothetical protein CY34DRAFT_810396, partial [Suillus luteus UH-Slu-Lm8-n1]